MMNFNSWNGFHYGYHFHLFFGSLLLIAAVLFVVWMIRYTKKDDLKNWIIGLLVVGLLGWIISTPTSGFGMQGMKSIYRSSIMGSGMFECMEDEECHEEMEEIMHRTMGVEEKIK